MTLNKLAESEVSLRDEVETAVVRPLQIDLENLRHQLRGQRVTRASLPQEMARDWVTDDGRERVEATPRGDPDDDETLLQFASAVLAVEPRATGPGISTVEWGKTILAAFVQAGAWALCSITLLLWIMLRRIGDVALTLIPLLVAAAFTLEICALSDFALNYANIIALPVLLGVGVAFKIYYVMAWHGGPVKPISSNRH